MAPYRRSQRGGRRPGVAHPESCALNGQRNGAAIADRASSDECRFRGIEAIRADCATLALSGDEEILRRRSASNKKAGVYRAGFHSPFAGG
jgi:hypothetical protein